MTMKPRPARTPPADPNLTRIALIDATEDIMRTEGYAAVSSRRIAAKVGVKGPTIHYYFKTIDNLYLAVFRRTAEAGIRRMSALIDDEQPLQALWAHANDPDVTKLATEFIALANHRPALRAEIAQFSNTARKLQIDIVRRYFERRNMTPPMPVEAVPTLMTGISFLLTLDASLGVSVGHVETKLLLEAILNGLEQGAAGPLPFLRAD